MKRSSLAAAASPNAEKSPKTTRPTRFVALAVVLAIALGSACGASVSAVYEGDVRFERCMALDWAPQVDAQLRRGCWEEWEKYFIAGQTRDRMEYAKLQLEKLRSSQVAVSTEAKPLLAVPEPTSVFAPPPMMLADAGAPADGGRPSPNLADAGSEPKSDCEINCDERVDECRGLCRGPVCEKACAAKRSRCMQRCR